MARPLRLLIENAIYDVTIRGQTRRPLFRNDQDRARMVTLLHDSAIKHDVRLIAFCLHGGDAHLIVQTPRANLNEFMQGLQTAYAMYYGITDRGTGPLVYDRYRAKVVEPGEHVLRLTRHVHRLPGARHKQYRWSSVSAYLKPNRMIPHIDLTHLRSSRKSYRDFLGDPDPLLTDALTASPLSIGSMKFNQSIRLLHRKRQLGGTPRRKKPARSRKEVLEIVCRTMGKDISEIRKQRKGSLLRPMAAHMLRRHAGMTQEDIAKYLGYRAGATVSVQLKRLRRAVQTDAKAERLVKKIDAELMA